MEDHNGLTQTKLGKVGEEFMHDKVVKELVFPKQKFASYAKLDFSNNPHSICRFMANKLEIEGEDKVKSWWDGVKKHVHEALNRHRNNVIKSLKQLFKGKECALCFGRGHFLTSCTDNCNCSEKILGLEGYVVTFELQQIAGMRSPASKENYID